MSLIILRPIAFRTRQLISVRNRLAKCNALRTMGQLFCVLDMSCKGGSFQAYKRDAIQVGWARRYGNVTYAYTRPTAGPPAYFRRGAYFGWSSGRVHRWRIHCARDIPARYLRDPL